MRYERASERHAAVWSEYDPGQCPECGSEPGWCPDSCETYQRGFKPKPKAWTRMDKARHVGRLVVRYGLERARTMLDPELAAMIPDADAPEGARRLA